MREVTLLTSRPTPHLLPGQPPLHTHPRVCLSLSLVVMDCRDLLRSCPVPWAQAPPVCCPRADAPVFFPLRYVLGCAPSACVQ